MDQKLFLTIKIDETIEDPAALTRDINKIKGVDKVEEKEASDFGTALVIAIISRLVVELIKQTPKAIRKLRKLIHKILEKRKKRSRGSGKITLTLHYEVQKLDFTLGMDDEMDQQLKELMKYISS